MAASTLSLQSIRPEYWMFLLAMSIAVILGLYVVGRLRAPWRRVVAGLVLLLVARILIFENPLAWELYARGFEAEDIGWRQHSVIVHRRDGYLRRDARPRYVAVGSSQTDRIFGEYARRHPELETFVLAGMTPIDMVLHQKQIDRIAADTILLYVSDFDLARQPPASAMVTAPRQGLRLAGIWRDLHAIPLGRQYTPQMAEMLLGEFFPEAKYGFVPRGFLNVAQRKVAARLGRAEAGSERESLAQRIAWLRQSFDERYLDLNLRFLERFLTHLANKGQEVVILEGRYNPLVDDDATDARAHRSREELRALSARFERVRFFESKEILALGEEDFDDLTHVTEETGQRIVRRLLARVEGRPIPDRYNPATDPAPRDSPWWSARVEELRRRIAAGDDADIVFLGDSITEGWEKEGAEVWARLLADHRAINLGAGGDRTEHLLWRLREMPLDRTDARMVVVMIGSNNVVRPSQSAQEITEGIFAVVEEVRNQLPDASILLLGLLPRDAAADPARAKIHAINTAISDGVEDSGVEHLDFGDAFLDARGEIPPSLMPDRLHLSTAGYEIWARAMSPWIAKWLGPGRVPREAAPR